MPLGIERREGDDSLPRYDLQGNLDLVVLKTLAQRGRLHGYGIVLHIHSESDELLQVEEGSLYPALHRMEQSGWINSEWLSQKRGGGQSTTALPRLVGNN
jgi:DNA-binding PadR family transcriptional regulator